MAGGGEAVICPHCGDESYAQSDTDGHASPKAGDVSICDGCLCVSVYVDGPLGMWRRKPTPEENTAFMAHRRVRDALAALATHRTSRDAVAALRRAAGVRP